MITIGNKKRTGPPYKEISQRSFENLCGLQCTQEEIANVLGISVDTLERWCIREYGQKFAEVFNEKRSIGKVSLRRMQFKLAEKNTAMAIFLGKNYLGQRDERDLEVKGGLMPTTLAELMLEGYHATNQDT